MRGWKYLFWLEIKATKIFSNPIIIRSSIRWETMHGGTSTATSSVQHQLMFVPIKPWWSEYIICFDEMYQPILGAWASICPSSLCPSPFSFFFSYIILFLFLSSLPSWTAVPSISLKTWWHASALTDHTYFELSPLPTSDCVCFCFIRVYIYIVWYI